MTLSIRRVETPSRSRRGFTLIELLVTTSMLGMLMLVLLPAVQAARESARRVQCKNNLKQIAIACYSHHDVHCFFPSGGWGWYWAGDADRGFGKDQPGGWIYSILPYFEQYSLYDIAADGDPDVMSRDQRMGASLIIQTPLSIINCPTRRSNSVYPLTSNAGGSKGFYNSITPGYAGRSDYAINSGHAYNEWPQYVLGCGPRSYEEARTWTANRYWGVDQVPFDRELRDQLAMTGISYERSAVSLRQVTAGLSQTYLVAEKHVPQEHYETGYDNGDNETWCTGFNNDNYRKTGRIENRNIVECAPTPDSATNVQDSGGRFGSAHPSVWNASFCDGSVRELAYAIDWRIHRDLGNRNAY